MIITFEGVPLADPEPFGGSIPAGTKTLLESGYYSVQVNTAAPIEWSFQCLTDSISDIWDLALKKGALGRLIVDGVTYANVGIVGEIRYDPIGCCGNYAYTVNFTQSV